MSDLKDREPEMQDEVKHKSKNSDKTGIVIAKYPLSNGNIVLDIRLTEEKIYYSSPIGNWEVTKACDE